MFAKRDTFQKQNKKLTNPRNFFNQNVSFIFMTRIIIILDRSVCEVYALLVIIYFSYPEEEENRAVCKVYDIASFVCVVRFTTSPLLSVW